MATACLASLRFTFAPSDSIISNSLKHDFEKREILMHYFMQPELSGKSRLLHQTERPGPYTHTYIYIYTYTHIFTRTHTHTNTHSQTHTYTHTQTLTHIC